LNGQCLLHLYVQILDLAPKFHVDALQTFNQLLSVDVDGLDLGFQSFFLFSNRLLLVLRWLLLARVLLVVFQLRMSLLLH